MLSPKIVIGIKKKIIDNIIVFMWIIKLIFLLLCSSIEIEIYLEVLSKFKYMTERYEFLIIWFLNGKNNLTGFIKVIFFILLYNIITLYLADVKLLYVGIKNNKIV